MQWRGRVYPGARAAKQRLMDRLLREVDNERVIRAMAQVPREAFVPAGSEGRAYEDVPLHIGYGQTISQPLMVALMTAALDPRPEAMVLEVGTGSGYQAAVLAGLVRHVTTVERIPALVYTAQAVLGSLGLASRVDVRLAGKVLGCPERALFDGILVTAGAPKVPRDLLQQLAPGGCIVMPVGSQHEQDLVRVARSGDGYSVQSLGRCRFVPLIGRSAWELAPR